MALSNLSENPGEEDPAILSEINITPLTDVFLVLLVIFMVTSSVMTQMGVEVNLPKASEKVASDQPEGVIVTLLSGNQIQINGETFSASDGKTVQARLKSLWSETSSRTVILEGDEKAFLGSVIEVMDWAKQAGALNFAIATKPR